jgi:hypothetical protein
MSENLHGNEEAPVENPVVTDQPDNAASGQVTRDAAAKQRKRLFQFNWIMGTLLGLLEVLLGLRFTFKLLAANPNSSLVAFIHGVAGVFTAPFTSLFGTPTFGGPNVEVTTLIAMVFYALLFWILGLIIQFAVKRTSPRTRPTRKQPPTERPVQ